MMNALFRQLIRPDASRCVVAQGSAIDATTAPLHVCRIVIPSCAVYWRVGDSREPLLRSFIEIGTSTDDNLIIDAEAERVCCTAGSTVWRPYRLRHGQSEKTVANVADLLGSATAPPLVTNATTTVCWHLSGSADRAMLNHALSRADRH